MAVRRPTLVLTLLVVLLLMCAVITLVLLSDEHQPSHGVSHDQFNQAMQQGGPGLERHREIRWFGLTLALLEVAFFVGCLLLGMRDLANRLWLFIICGVLYALVFAATIICDHFYAAGQARQIVLGFPLPTALMIYGVGGVPVAFILIYVFFFDRWILTPADLARFEQLVREKRREQEQESTR